MPDVELFKFKSNEQVSNMFFSKPLAFGMIYEVIKKKVYAESGSVSPALLLIKHMDHFASGYTKGINPNLVNANTINCRSITQLWMTMY